MKKTLQLVTYSFDSNFILATEYLVDFVNWCEEHQDKFAGEDWKKLTDRYDADEIREYYYLFKIKFLNEDRLNFFRLSYMQELSYFTVTYIIDDWDF